MTACSRFACIILLAGFAIPLAAQSNQYIYVRSNFDQPWGQSTNEDAMDTIFGAGNWTTMYYETTSAASLFSPSTLFIFMEGGDTSFDGFQNFITNNAGPLADWIYQGGRLLIVSAPNDPLQGATVSLPNNIVLHSDAFYGSAASSASAITPPSTIFSSPNQVVCEFTGNFFAHGYFTGDNVTTIMQSNLGEIVLGQDSIGSGLMVFGGMTTDNFQMPQPDAHLLLENIIHYTALSPLH